MRSATLIFEMKNGQDFACDYSYNVSPGRFSGPLEDCYPDEVEIAHPSFYIGYKKVDPNNLPKGLDAIAKAMLEDGWNDRRFMYIEDPS